MVFNLKVVSFILLIAIHADLSNSQSPRSLLSWQRDLEYRINSYSEKLSAINTILTTSIYPERVGELVEPTKISGSHVRFSNLIISGGSLILNPTIARSTVSVLNDKTQKYVDSKRTELGSIREQLDNFRRQLNDTNRRFVYKGTPSLVEGQFIHLNGTRVFKQFLFGQLIESRTTILRSVNHTDVEKVLAATYMESHAFGLRDHRSRLFFEGKKTFWKTIFKGQLKSGCCDRLRPLHTNRMMIRSRHQDIVAPILFHTNNPYNKKPISIRSLSTRQLSNQIIAVGVISAHTHDNGLITSPQENLIHPSMLLELRGNWSDISYKTLIFMNSLGIQHARLAPIDLQGSTVIDIVRPEIRFNISHKNYLLRHLKSNSIFQHLEGRLIINSESRFHKLNLETESVNGVFDFNQFVRDVIVRVDRAANITGLVQFNALPSLFNLNKPSIRLQSVPILTVFEQLNADLINGMRLPNDIVLFNQLNFSTTIVIRGPRSFTSQLIFQRSLEVEQLINNMQMPDGVIPLHMNDAVNPHSFLNLWFLDGIEVGDLRVDSGLFGDINLSETYGDAQNIIMRSMIVPQPDGTQVIKAPLHISNLKFSSHDPNSGLLNGFKPQGILELIQDSSFLYQTIQGRKTFSQPVEATECLFGDINLLANWTNHLIRIDRPNTVQIIHSRLAFLQPALYTSQGNHFTYAPPISQHNKLSSVAINNLQVEFLPNNDPLNYVRNFELSPELYVLHQALLRNVTTGTEGRIRVEYLQMLNAQSTINGVALNNIVTLDTPFRFAGKFVMVGKVEVLSTLTASRIISNYPIDSMDLVQFEKYRIPITYSPTPIKLNNLLFSTNNQASFANCYMINGIKFTDFANSIMSLTKPQLVDSKLIFDGPVNLEGIVRTQSVVNGIRDFRSFASNLKRASYSFEDGLQCHSITIKT